MTTTLKMSDFVLTVNILKIATHLIANINL